MSIKKFLKNVLSEDIGRGDLFSKVYIEKEDKRAYVISKSNGVFGGRKYLNILAKMYKLEMEWNIADGESFKAGEKLFFIKANATTLLILERSILNISLHSSSIATLTAKYVEKISKYKVKLLDTRKTKPLLREFEKYSVSCGGGINHRMGLDDSLMLKDTHLKIILNIKSFIREARKKIPFTSTIEIECENIEMAKNMMKLDVNIIMCDNMSILDIRDVVKFRNINYPKILIEASGNISLDNIEEFARTGVDAISSGSLIHQANWIDFSMKIE